MYSIQIYNPVHILICFFFQEDFNIFISLLKKFHNNVLLHEWAFLTYYVGHAVDAFTF